MTTQKGVKKILETDNYHKVNTITHVIQNKSIWFNDFN